MRTVLANYKKHIDHATKFIPTWVKVAVALALGLGTMIGWKRIVITVGEKIGKDHLTYGQGAAAEITAMLTIGAADMYGLPVSTTHVLSSGVAGTMAANGTGLQWGNGAQPDHGLGADAAGGHRVVGNAVLGLCENVVRGERRALFRKARRSVPIRYCHSSRSEGCEAVERSRRTAIAARDLVVNRGPSTSAAKRRLRSG